MADENVKFLDQESLRAIRDWTNDNFYSSESVEDISTMGQLRTFINNVNSQGRHCFFDLHNYVDDAYVCIVHCFTEGNVNYCFIQDLINHKTYGDYAGYSDETTITSYLSSNAMSNIKVIKITDANTTLSQIATLLGEINSLHDYVMFDVAAITSAMYLTTIYINGSYYRVYDSVTGRTASGTSATSLSETLKSVIEGGVTEPTSFAEVSQLIQEGNGGLVYPAGSNVLTPKIVKSANATSSNAGLTITCDMDDFAEQVRYNSGSYEFTYSSSLSGWTYGGGTSENVVNLADYGITLSGSPSNNDTLTVVLVCDDLEIIALGSNQDEVTETGRTNTLSVMTKFTNDTNFVFDPREAFFTNNTGETIPSGTTLHFLLGAHSWYSEDVNKNIQFTLPVDLPDGGQIVFNQAYNAAVVGATGTIYNGPNDTTSRGTVTFSEGSDGTDLGTLNNGMTTGSGLNQCQRALLGNNDQDESPLIQYLNSDEEKGTYWVPKNIWDRKPSYVDDLDGFLKHLQRDFVAIIGTAKKTTEKVQFSSTGISGAPRQVSNMKVWLLSREEIQSESQNEYNSYPSYTYWHNLIGSNYGDWQTRSAWIMTNKAGTAQYWWLRSPTTNSGNYVRFVLTSGNCSDNNAGNSHWLVLGFALI